MVTIKDEQLRIAAQEGMDAFVKCIADAIKDSVGGELNMEAFQKLNGDQITLWGYTILHEELMDGGFIQLIHNGYGPFFFDNPFAKAMRLWGLKDFSKLIYKAKELYDEHKEELTVIAPTRNSWRSLSNTPPSTTLTMPSLKMKKTSRHALPAMWMTTSMILWKLSRNIWLQDNQQKVQEEGTCNRLSL